MPVPPAPVQRTRHVPSRRPPGSSTSMDKGKALEFFRRESSCSRLRRAPRVPPMIHGRPRLWDVQPVALPPRKRHTIMLELRWFLVLLMDVWSPREMSELFVVTLQARTQESGRVLRGTLTAG